MAWWWFAALFVIAGCGGQGVAFSDGTTAAWDSFEGRWLVVNYWAEWCKPCLEEIPELNELDHEAHVTVLGVNYDDIRGEELDELMERLGIAFRVVVEDPGSRWGVQKPEVLPTTLVIDPEANLHAVLVGPQDRASILAAFDAAPNPAPAFGTPANLGDGGDMEP